MTDRSDDSSLVLANVAARHARGVVNPKHMAPGLDGAPTATAVADDFERSADEQRLVRPDMGVYACRACDAELFRSREKFDSHCGWPSFFAPLAEDRVDYIEDRAFGMKRVEVRCANCGSHLGHVFEGEGYDTPTDLRYCINSISLRRAPIEGVAEADDSSR